MTINPHNKHELFPFASYGAWRMQAVLRTEPGDRLRCKDALNSLYEAFGFEHPQIIWCQGPLQLAERAQKTINNFDGQLTRQIGVVCTLAAAAEWRELGVVQREHLNRALILTNEQIVSLRTIVDTALNSKSSMRLLFASGWQYTGWSSNLTEQYLLKRAMRLIPAHTVADAWAILSIHSTGILPSASVCYVCENPKTIELDESRRPHNLNGPAITFDDGFAVYAIQGIVVSAVVVEHPELITTKMIFEEANSESRRIMIERYGFDRFLSEGNATLAQQDEYGELFYIPGRRGRDESALQFVRVKNSTADPDGSFKHYILRVPPQIRTAREGVAWTFGMTAEEYRPKIET